MNIQSRGSTITVDPAIRADATYVLVMIVAPVGVSSIMLSKYDALRLVDALTKVIDDE